MVQNSPKLYKFSKWFNMVRYCLKRFKMVKKKFNIVRYCPKRFKMVEKSLKWSKMVQFSPLNGPIWSKLILNYFSKLLQLL